MIVLLKLILAHLIGDFILQPKKWIDSKESKKLKSGSFYLHIVVHGVLVLLVMAHWDYWQLILSVILAHAIIDALKLYLQKPESRVKWFLLDQILHIGSLILIWWYFEIPDLDLFTGITNDTILIYVIAIILITSASSVLIQTLMSTWASELVEPNSGSLKNAGKFIGILERLFVFTFVVTGNWTTIGYLLAAKSVFRFGDLRESRDRKLTEYILVGTLLSFGIAISIGMSVNYISSFNR